MSYVMLIEELVSGVDYDAARSIVDDFVHGPVAAVTQWPDRETWGTSPEAIAATKAFERMGG